MNAQELINEAHQNHFFGCDLGTLTRALQVLPHTTQEEPGVVAYFFDGKTIPECDLIAIVENRDQVCFVSPKYFFVQPMLRVFLRTEFHP